MSVSPQTIAAELERFGATFPYSRFVRAGSVSASALEVWREVFEDSLVTEPGFRAACKSWRATEDKSPTPASILGTIGASYDNTGAARPDGCRDCDYTGRVWYGWHGISDEGRHSFRDCVVPCGCGLGRHYAQQWSQNESMARKEIKSDSEHRAWLERGVNAGAVVSWWRGNMPKGLRSRVCRTVDARNSLRVVEA